MNTPKLTHEQIRAAGGIVHSDGNIFFTNIEKLNDALAAIQAQGVPDGWQLVPKEPTDAMIRAALHLDLSYMPGHDGPDRAAVYKAMLASAHPAPQPAQANYLEMIYEYLVSTAPAGYADEAFREVPEEVFAADSRNRISERRASLSQHTGQLPAALGQEEVGTRQAGFDVTSAHPAPQQKPQASVVQQEPVMIYHGDCTIDCGEHGHHHVELLKMIPAGSHLYTHPAQQAKPQPLSDEHVTDGSKCWCDPELAYKDPESGAEVWVHRGKQ